MEGNRQITYVDGKKKADYYNVQYMESSPMNNDNIEDAFVQLVREIKGKIAINNPYKSTGKTK